MRAEVRDSLRGIHEASDRFWQEHDFQSALEGELAQFQAAADVVKSELHGNDRLLTVPTILTAMRPLIAGAVIAPKLIRNEVGVTPWMVAMMATDAEGFVARSMDRHLPDLHLGSSKFGAKADPPADTLAITTVSLATLRSHRIPTQAKAAVGAVLATEVRKTGWAMHANYRHILAHGEQLAFHPDMMGKFATAQKLGAITLAVYCHDLEDGPQKQHIANAALVCGTLGAVSGEIALNRYRKKYRP